MNMQTIGDDIWPVSAIANGWQKVKEKAQHALTRFKPTDDEASSADTASQWGVLAADMVEHDDCLELRMEVPGMSPKELQIEVVDRNLLISGTRRSESSRKQGTALITERAFGQFRRVFSLPSGVDVESVKAKYRKGVLIIKFPKKQAGKALRREVSIS